MKHPLITEGHNKLRKQVVQFLKETFEVNRESNIIFVCGGNDKRDMRMRFLDHCTKTNVNFEMFIPEYAIESYFRNEISEPFNIAEFEKIVGDLSLAIVIFPEAPGSFVETGYFSLVKVLSKKSILVLNSKLQGQDSFISLGPVKAFNKRSKFEPVIQLDYKDPDFSIILDRIGRVRPHKTKPLSLNKYKELTVLDQLSLVDGLVAFLSIATADDIQFMLRAIFNSDISVKSIQTIPKLISILRGSNHFKEVGKYGHYAVNNAKERFLKVKETKKSKLDEINLTLLPIYQEYNEDFFNLFVEAKQC